MDKIIKHKVELFVDKYKDEIEKNYEEFVNLNSFWKDVEDCNIVAEWLKNKFEIEGVDCQLVELSKKAGKFLVGTWGAEYTDKPILFSGHMDTALESDLFPKNSFKIENGRAYGPGVLDMKGGILISLYVIKFLNFIGYKERPIKILYVSDEEGLHNFTSAAEYIQEVAKDCLFAFNMETGLMNNGLAIGRKGRLGIDVYVKGRAAHAGAAFLDGISSIEEMAKKIMEFQKLTDLDKGTTVNTGVVKGGTIPNAVPEDCMCRLDIRFKTIEEMNRVKKSVKEICEKNFVDGTSCIYEELNLFPPLETDDKILKLFSYMSKIAEENGYEETIPTQVGGCSDATFIQSSGTPVLCSCGPKGNWNHTTREFVIMESLFERVKWLSTAVIESSTFYI